MNANVSPFLANHYFIAYTFGLSLSSENSFCALEFGSLFISTTRFNSEKASLFIFRCGHSAFNLPQYKTTSEMVQFLNYTSIPFSNGLRFMPKSASMYAESSKNRSKQSSQCRESMNRLSGKLSQSRESINRPSGKLSQSGESINRPSGTLSQCGESMNCSSGTLSPHGDAKNGPHFYFKKGKSTTSYFSV